MSALMTPRPARRRRTRPAAAPGGQSALFGAGAAPASPAAPAAPEPHAAPAEPTAAAATVESPETDTTARAHRHGPTLDDLVAGAWEGLLAGAPASCVVCGTTMHPRYSGGHAPVGGRCTGCGTTLG
jgi:hypothetical protein